MEGQAKPERWVMWEGGRGELSLRVRKGGSGGRGELSLRVRKVGQEGGES